MIQLIQMARSAARSVLASRSRFVLTGTAITLSVAFLVATLVLSDSMRGRAAADIAEAKELLRKRVQKWKGDTQEQPADAAQQESNGKPAKAKK